MDTLKVRSILLVADDNPDDRLLIEEAWQEASSVNLQLVEDGEELMNVLHHRSKLFAADLSDVPNLILIDLNMPRKNGYEALAEIKTTPGLKKIPVVVMTTSAARSDINRSYELGASAYITKPNSFDELVELMQVLHNYWFETITLPD
ncbi:MAG: response regulator [Lyngbya sp. HA4199-MV5]|jgi:CheY-like chemotaxis protein|nr:response regulator [Lyngbya sp. HA4199-MV5]